MFSAIKKAKKQIKEYLEKAKYRKYVETIPRQYSLVKLVNPERFEGISDFTNHRKIIFLGEIPNMTYHCVVAVNGKIVSGWHTENFVELTKEDT